MKPSSMLAWTYTTADPTTNIVDGTEWLRVMIGSTVVAAVVSGLVSVVLAWRSSRLDERSRVRAAFADASRACAEYKEMPNAIRRRRSDVPGEERVRLSEELRGIQARLSYHQSWTRIECPAAGSAYDELVRQIRAEAGIAMREAWAASPLDSDTGMNISKGVTDLSALQDVEQAFVTAASEHAQHLGSSWRRWRHRCDVPSKHAPQGGESTG